MNISNPNTFNIFLAIFFIATTVFSFLLNRLLLKFSKNLGIRNHDETIIRWSETSKPALGGITFYIIFLISGASYSLFFEQQDILFNIKLLGLFAASGLGFLMGLSDDAYNTKPGLKFIVQVLCGVILTNTGTQITLFGNDVINHIITVIWVIGIMNSINMLDNMDGITTIVSIFILITALISAFFGNPVNNIFLFLIMGVLSALIGFLFYNWNPSKMFMGDTGSQFLGVFLSAISITYLWNHNVVLEVEAATKQIIIVMLAFIVPIIDTTTVSINRISRGQSPFVGGKDHTTHHLSYLGLSDRQVALLLALVCFLSLLLVAAIILLINTWSYWYFLFFLIYFLILFTLLFSTTHLSKAEQKNEDRNPMV